MCISLTGHLQQGMIKRRRAHILHTWEVCEISSKGRKKPGALTPAKLPPNVDGSHLGWLCPRPFPHLLAVVHGGAVWWWRGACPLLPWWYGVTTTCVLAYRCLCPPLMSQEILRHPLRISLKSADLMSFWIWLESLGGFFAVKTKQKTQTTLPDATLLVYHKTKQAVILSQIHMVQGWWSQAEESEASKRPGNKPCNNSSF